MPKSRTKSRRKLAESRAKPRPARPIQQTNLPLHSPSLKTTLTESTGLSYAPVYDAINIISSGVAGFPLNVRKKRPSGGSDLATDSPVQFLVHSQPNIEQAPNVWKSCLVAMMALWGNAYAWIERNGAQEVINLWPQHPFRVRTLRDTKTFSLFYEITGSDGTKVQLLPSEMIHVPLLGDGIVGRSPLSLARQSVGLGIAMDRHAGALFGNWGVPAGVLQHPNEIGEVALDTLRRGWHEQVGGDSAGGIAILEEGMKFQAIGMPNDDAQFLESRGFQVKDIARWWRIPLHMLADMSGGVRANIEAENRTFLNNTLLPYVEKLEEELTRKLLPRTGGWFIKANTQAFLRGETKARSEFYKRMRELGVFSVNEIRVLEDMNPIGPEGDVRITPLNFQPLEALLETDGTEPTEPVVPPEDEPKPDADRAVRVIFRDVCGRIVRKESAAMARLAKKHADDSDALRAAATKLYHTLEADLDESLSLLTDLGFAPDDVKRDASRTVEWLRRDMLNGLPAVERDEGERVAQLVEGLHK